MTSRSEVVIVVNRAPVLLGQQVSRSEKYVSLLQASIPTYALYPVVFNLLHWALPVLVIKVSNFNPYVICATSPHARPVGDSGQ